ncbi:DUF4158 domain-containing protein [Streptomyces sp. NPDC018057]|uniref:DUF4158 domain-containing protein n=1 Tax=unclassified Streptomyces TaxID=2593676 RepID=UPI0037875D92
MTQVRVKGGQCVDLESLKGPARHPFDSVSLRVMLKSYLRMGCFPVLEDVPEQVVGFVRRQVELPEGALPVYRAERTAKHHRGLVRKWVGVAYDQAQARRIAEESIREEAVAKNRSADLINIALEKVVEAGLELPAAAGGARQRRHDAFQPVEEARQGAELVALQEPDQAHGVAGRPRRQRGVNGRRRRTEDHRLHRGGGRGGRAGASGLHAGQAPHADRVPGPQGRDAGP